MGTITYKRIDKTSGKNEVFNDEIITGFLYKHLEQHGDPVESIQKAVDYIFEQKGGFILIQIENGEITGISLVNETGMKGYIPENMLVYIAVRNGLRGKGYGKELMEKTLELCKGDVALHVEKNNTARFLYEKMGFTNPYLEMRLKRR